MAYDPRLPVQPPPDAIDPIPRRPYPPGYRPLPGPGNPPKTLPVEPYPIRPGPTPPGNPPAGSVPPKYQYYYNGKYYDSYADFQKAGGQLDPDMGQGRAPTPRWSAGGAGTASGGVGLPYLGQGAGMSSSTGRGMVNPNSPTYGTKPYVPGGQYMPGGGFPPAGSPYGTMVVNPSGGSGQFIGPDGQMLRAPQTPQEMAQAEMEARNLALKNGAANTERAINKGTEEITESENEARRMAAESSASAGVTNKEDMQGGLQALGSQYAGMRANLARDVRMQRENQQRAEDAAFFDRMFRYGQAGQDQASRGGGGGGGGGGRGGSGGSADHPTTMGDLWKSFGMDSIGIQKMAGSGGGLGGKHKNAGWAADTAARSLGSGPLFAPDSPKYRRGNYDQVSGGLRNLGVA